MITFVNNFILRTVSQAQALAANRRGADSLEWLVVAVLIVGAFFAAFAAFGGQVQDVATRVQNWLN